MEEQPSDVVTKPYDNLRGRELIAWALDEGEACLDDLSPVSTQARYFQAVARSAGVEYPGEFFKSSIEQLIDHHRRPQPIF